MSRKLTEKQKNFIKAFLKRLCGTKSVVEAYPEVKNRNTAGVMAHELLHNPKIKEIIDEQFNKGNCVGAFVDFEITE
jgi:phage terminase small subunit